ncbi:MAG: alpha-hydroxy-acid oxidizing protein [Actinomycetes bacterium]|jgi:glutamate synthase domain-containing protein 2|nr:alpha-hydroxy-acid oxidizing protein [Actinomycetes bacterium]
MINYLQPEFHVDIDYDRCHKCGRCAGQCGWGVYSFVERPLPDDAKCRACHRCVTFCPAHCITIKRSDLAYRENPNWPIRARKGVWRQAASGGVLLTSMGSDAPRGSIFDALTLDACQVTNPSIDPLREPMETRTVIGKRPRALGERVPKDWAGRLTLSTPILFAPMSFGSVSLNVHKSMAMAAKRLGTFMNTGEGGLHADLYPYQDNVIVQVASGRFGVTPEYLERGAAIEIKVGQGAKPGIGGHLPGEKINAEVSTTRMIPQGTDAISPAPHHDIYSIEDLRQLIYSLKEASGYKPVGVKIAAVHNVGAIASGIVRAGADYVYLDGMNGGTGAAPAVIRDHVGIPVELALAVVDQRLRDEGIRNEASIIVAGSIKSSADLAKALALGADAVALGSATLLALGCHLCQSCHTGCCSWGLTTQKPELTRRLDPEEGAQRLVNLVSAWTHELQEILGALGVNAVESLRGSRDRLRAIGLDAQTCEILGVAPAGR